MKLFKQIDLYGQAFLILFFFSSVVFACSSGIYFYGYFIVGGWQLLSCFAHLFLRNSFFSHRDRRTYQQIILLLLLMGIPGAIVNLQLLVFFLLALLFIYPFLAVWYWQICYRELSTLNRKMMVHLK